MKPFKRRTGDMEVAEDASEYNEDVSGAIVSLRTCGGCI